jgi:hypothetical protein
VPSTTFNNKENVQSNHKTITTNSRLSEKLVSELKELNKFI